MPEKPLNSQIVVLDAEVMLVMPREAAAVAVRGYAHVTGVEKPSCARTASPMKLQALASQQGLRAQ